MPDEYIIPAEYSYYTIFNLNLNYYRLPEQNNYQLVNTQQAEEKNGDIHEAGFVPVINKRGGPE